MKRGTTICKELLFLFFSLMVLTAFSQAAAQTWTELFPTGGPLGNRNNHTAVYDSSNNLMIVFGGIPYHTSGAPTLYNDVWVLSNADGAEASTPTWTQLSLTGGPTRRGFHSAVYDSATNRMIVFGGDPHVGYCYTRTNDVWILEYANGVSGTPNWIKLTPTGGPPSPRGIHSAVYDSATNRMIVFGGGDSCAPYTNDVWVLEYANGVGGTPNWIQLIPTGAVPIPTGGHSAVFDQANNRMIVFVGVHCCANDVYVLENANGIGGPPNWIQLTPSGTLPEEGSWQTAVYDPDINRMILFGGFGVTDGTGYLLNDLWLLSNANGLDGTPEWIQLSPAGGPPVPRQQHTAIYNPAANRMTVFGGGTYGLGLNDVWVLSDATGITNNPPILDPVGDKIGFEGLLLEFIITASDPDAGDSLTLEASNLPSGATFTQTDGTTGTFSWTPDYNQEGNYEDIVYCVTDDGDPVEVDCESITITIGNINRPPVFDLVAPIDVQEYSLIEFIVTATDPDGDYFDLSSGVLPVGSLFDDVNGTFSWIPSYDQAGIHIVTFYATDNGVPSEIGQLDVIITVNDIPPTALNDEIIDTFTNDMVLPQEVVNSYIANLKKVNVFIENGKINPAINQLNAFINKVNEDVVEGLLNTADGQMLIDMANDIISKLSQ